MKTIKQPIRNLAKDLWIVLCDIIAVNASYLLALLIRFYVNNQFRPTVSYYLSDFATFAPFYTIACIITFAFFRLYGGMWRYAGVNDMNRIIGATIVTSALQVAGTMLFIRRMPITYYVIGALLQFIFVSVVRFSYRIFFVEKIRLGKKSAINVMIVGIGETGRIVRHQIETDPTNAAKPVCIFTHRDREAGYNIDGIPVVNDISKIKNHIKNYKVERVILADSIMPMDIRKAIKEACHEVGVEVQDFSGYLRVDNGGIPFQRLMEYTSGEVTVISDGEINTFENGELALMTLVGKHDVKNISVRDNRLFIELFSYKVNPLHVFYITNRPDVALVAEKYGVDRIWIDIETIGKELRQKNMNTVKSHHTIHDIEIIKPLLTKAEMMVRVNSWYEDSPAEIDAVIAAGADIIMLPYWKTVTEVDNFLNTVNKRCKTSLLLETKEAVNCVDEVLQRDFDEIHIGLNDLSISYGLTFMFELLSNGTVEMLCEKFKRTGIPYGFGGIAKLGDGLLPAEKIIMEHYRLGSTRAILSRTFCDCSKIEDIEEIDDVFRENMETLREYEISMANVTREEFIRNKMEIAKAVEDIVERINRVRNNEQL